MFGLLPNPQQRLPPAAHAGAPVVPHQSTGHPGGMTHAPRSPGAGSNFNPIGGERSALYTQMAKQKFLANALRGGMANGVPQPAPQLGIQRPQGLPTIK